MVPGLVKVADDTVPSWPPARSAWCSSGPRGARFDYYGDPDKTAGAFRGDYFTLGDMGTWMPRATCS